MKPQEAKLVNELSKLQCMVSELKTGFTSAMLELGQIQNGDVFLRDEMEENRRSCQKKAHRLEGLVEALREELGVMRCQIVQLYRNRNQEVKTSSSKQEESEPAEPDGGQRVCCECSPAPPASASLSRGKLLLHCFLQGLKAGLSEGTDARHQVAMQLLHSEWEYVSTLNHLYDKYKTPPAHQMSAEPYQTYGRFVEQLLQRHLLFRNTLQERLSAEHWKSLVGDILVQLIGQNDAAFSDMYFGYTTTLASFLSLEFKRLGHLEKSSKVQAAQGGETERGEMKLLSLLLAPVARIHSYLSHIQNLLQWTVKEHPDCSLLLGTERALRGILSRCHVVLEEDVRWEDGDAAARSCMDAAAAANCCARSQQNREESTASGQSRVKRTAAGLANGQDPCHAMRLECWSCSPVRRKGCGGESAQMCHLAPGCEHAYCSSLLLTPDAAGWGETSDSGQGTYSYPTGKGANRAVPPHSNHKREDCETDSNDTSAFDYSSVTSCSPDGTLRRETTDSHSEMDEEEDSQVPVLLKPSYPHQQQQQTSPSNTPRERSVCLRWQIPRVTPHPPLKSPTGPCGEEPHTDGPTPCLVGSYGTRLVSVKKGSPPLHPKSAFRPIWDDPSKQADTAPEKDNRQSFLPIQAASRQNYKNFNPVRENLRPGLPQRGNPPMAPNSGGLWDDSEDSEGPCSTV